MIYFRIRIYYVSFCHFKVFIIYIIYFFDYNLIPAPKSCHIILQYLTKCIFLLKHQDPNPFNLGIHNYLALF